MGKTDSGQVKSMNSKEKQGKRKRIVPKLAASKRFGMYKKEEMKRVRKADVRQDATLARLREAWKKYELEELALYSRIITDFLKKIPYSPEDLDRFVISLAEFQDERNFPDKAGAFLSALISNGAGGGYVIDISHLPPLNGLGFKNSQKDITVNGDAGSHIGMQMEKGTIVINGDVCDNLGAFMEGGKIEIGGNAGKGIGFCMRGGEILVEKNAGLSAGSGMTGGMIVIEGNAGSFLGANMNGGVIRIEGEIDSIGNVNSGKIFHKGKLIVDK